MQGRKQETVVKDRGYFQLMQKARAIKDSGIHGRVAEIPVEFPLLVIDKFW